MGAYACICGRRLCSGCRLSWHEARHTLCRPNRPTAHWLTYVHRWLLSMVQEPPKHSARRERVPFEAIGYSLLQIENGKEATDE